MTGNDKKLWMENNEIIEKKWKRLDTSNIFHKQYNSIQYFLLSVPTKFDYQRNYFKIIKYYLYAPPIVIDWNFMFDIARWYTIRFTFIHLKTKFTHKLLLWKYLYTEYCTHICYRYSLLENRPKSRKVMM